MELHMDTTNGLVFSYLLNETSSQLAGWEQVKKWSPSQGVLWVHLDYADPSARTWLSEESGLDAISCAALLENETRPRIVSSADSLLLILRGVNCNPGADPEDMVSIRMWCEEHRVISMRHRRVMAIDDIRQCIDSGKGPASVGELLSMFAGKLVDRMGDIIAGIDDNADELEALVLTAESHELRPKLADLRRKTISLRRYISPQRDVLARLQNERISWLSDIERVRMREIAERTARYVDDLDAVRDRATITQEELNSRLSEQSNKTMYILAIVTAIFLPLGLLTGLLGINVGGMPGTDNRFAFSFVLLLLVVFAFIQYIIFKKKRII
jgi:zinc transporter